MNWMSIQIFPGEENCFSDPLPTSIRLNRFPIIYNSKNKAELQSPGRFLLPRRATSIFYCPPNWRLHSNNNPSVMWKCRVEFSYGSFLGRIVFSISFLTLPRRLNIFIPTSEYKRRILAMALKGTCSQQLDEVRRITKWSFTKLHTD
jgi:hypothetical protein